MTYLNIYEVESALKVATSAPYTAFTDLITLPNLTWEGRQCHAIKIAKGNNPGRPGVFFLGGVHGCEWGSPDILINFIEQLEKAYLANTGITLGGKNFLDSDIKTIVEKLDIFVFPQANPDGRLFSMNADTKTDKLWRKNRRTNLPSSNVGNAIGVDINRNYDFLWDFRHQFATSAPVNSSTDPSSWVFIGPNAFSEPESLNVKWMHDTFHNIGYFIDLHCYGPQILYSWGDDDNQSTDTSLSFKNAAYNGVRGIPDKFALPGSSAYREFIPTNDLATVVDLANCFAINIQAVRGKTYLVEQAVQLYPTSGSSDDYAYSRHFVDASKQKVISYTLEWGEHSTEYTPFQPPYTEMQNIIQEITSGLLGFCLQIAMSVKQNVSQKPRQNIEKAEDIRDLQEELSTATPGAKGRIVSGIKNRSRKLNE